MNKIETMITEQELEFARKLWGDALIAISTAFDNEGIEAATNLANNALDLAYGYDLGPVLFKPTTASGEQTFRPTREGALSYFVGHNNNYPQDKGFGLKSWRKVDSRTAASLIQTDIALWMGVVSFTDKDGGVITVDKSWGYKKDDAGKLRIILHHSSLPYSPHQ